MPRRAAIGRRSFASSLKALETLAADGARVSVHVSDLDRGTVVLAGDDFVTLPTAGVGKVLLLVEVAAQIDEGTLDPFEPIERASVDPLTSSGLWQHLKSPTLPVIDLAVLAASNGDALAANVLLQRVGLEAVRSRAIRLGLARSALLDRVRERRGPDDAPHFSIGTTRELAGLFSALVNSQVGSPAVSAQVSEWLSLNNDLSLVASGTGLNPFAHENDEHGLLFINKTGWEHGVRAEAGVLAGPRAGIAYSVIVCFDDLSLAHRLRAHDALRTVGIDLMEYVF